MFDIKNAETISTRSLTIQTLHALHAGKRVRFFVSRGKGARTVQCIRVMLSRTRVSMRAKGKRFKRFRLEASVFPHTDLGSEPKRLDCVIFTLVRKESHQILETLEDMMVNDTETQSA